MSDLRVCLYGALWQPLRLNRPDYFEFGTVSPRNTECMEFLIMQQIRQITL